MKLKLYQLAASVLIPTLYAYWLVRGIVTTVLNADVARDLGEMSNIWIHQLVWLGPTLTSGFPSSPVHYYLFIPGLKIFAGNPNSLIVTTSFLASITLSLFLWLGMKRWKAASLYAVIAIGLSDWWLTSVTRPGNGYTYVIILLLSLVCLWFELPFCLSALFLGIAFGLHPVALFAIPLFLYEIWRRKKYVLDALTLVSGLLLPWVPVILFTLITKGYYLKDWFKNPSAGVHLASASLSNVYAMLYFMGLDQKVFIVLWFGALILTKGRTRIWLLLSSLPLVFLVFATQLVMHYFLGMICIVFFALIVGLMEKKPGRVMVMVLAVCLAFGALRQPITLSPRSFASIGKVSDDFLSLGLINRQEKIAVLSILDPSVAVPAADDYRFFLRVKHYNVVALPEADKANILLLFVEVPHFHWQTWSNYETDLFGGKKLMFDEMVNGVEVVGFSKR